jgi:hypothetical protein
MSEMTVADPIAAAFITFAAKAFGRAYGFVVGWGLLARHVLGMSSEATADSILLGRYLHGISLPLTGSVIIVAVTLLNFLGAVRLSSLEAGSPYQCSPPAVVYRDALLLIAALRASPPSDWAKLHGAYSAGRSGGLLGSMLVVMFLLRV